MKKDEPLKIIIIFKNTPDAVKTEKLATADGMPGKLVPVPRKISKGCGLGWLINQGEEEKIRSVMFNNGIVPEDMLEYE